MSDGHECFRTPDSLPPRFLSAPECETVARAIAESVRRYDPVHLLTGFSIPNFLSTPSDSCPAFLEHIHHLILAHRADPTVGRVDESVVNDLWDQVRSLFWGSVFSSASSLSDLGARGSMPGMPCLPPRRDPERRSGFRKLNNVSRNRFLC